MKLYLKQTVYMALGNHCHTNYAGCLYIIYLIVVFRKNARDGSEYACELEIAYKCLCHMPNVCELVGLK